MRFGSKRYARAHGCDTHLARARGLPADTAAGTRLYLDPFLTGNPSCLDTERDAERCDLVVVTHGHDDHVGDTVAIAQRFDCPVVAQVELRGWLSGKGRPRT